MPKVINAGRARVRFAFSDSWLIVVLKHLIKLHNSEGEIMPLLVTFLNVCELFISKVLRLDKASETESRMLR